MFSVDTLSFSNRRKQSFGAFREKTLEHKTTSKKKLTDLRRQSPLSQNNQTKKPTAADFFAGCGLATEGLKRSFDILWANDIDATKARAYRANHGAEHFHQAPVETFKANEVPCHDLSWASFPCQDLSLAGKGEGIKAKRSGTVWEWIRILQGQANRPKIVVAENVLGLLTSKNGANYEALHRALGDLGYRCGALVLNAKNWIPQSRGRVFVIGVESSLNTGEYETTTPSWAHSREVQRVADNVDRFVLWDLSPPKRRVKTLEDLIDLSNPVDDKAKRDRNLALITTAHWKKIREAEKRGARVFTGYKRIRNGEQCLEIRTDGVAGCLRTPAGGSSRQHIVISTEKSHETRLLSIAEAAQLMGARKTYKFPGSYNDGYKALGDAVAVPVVHHLAVNLLRPILENR
jgi:DNA (cytosine-5)-methyltransferase 1